jgi:hypothetical protein
MNTQHDSFHDHSGRATRRVLLGGQAITVEHAPGEFTVIDGRVWLTRRGDPDDHVLDEGAHARIERGEAAVIESWDARRSATVRWRGTPQRLGAGAFLRTAKAVGLRWLARGTAAGAAALRRAEAALADLSAWARNAASNASRTQGSIAGGESIAS